MRKLSFLATYYPWFKRACISAGIFVGAALSAFVIGMVEMVDAKKAESPVLSSLNDNSKLNDSISDNGTEAIEYSTKVMASLAPQNLEKNPLLAQKKLILPNEAKTCIHSTIKLGSQMLNFDCNGKPIP